jgi:hypothetical protein
MPRRSPKRLPVSEVFRFEVAEWSFDYGFHLNSTGESTVRGHLGPCWETNAVEIRGPLRSKTKRRIKDVTLTLWPGAPDAETWDMRRRRFGGVSWPSRGVLAGTAQLPTMSFLTIVAALSAGKIRGMSITVDREVEKDAITSIYTSDLGDGDE